MKSNLENNNNNNRVYFNEPINTKYISSPILISQTTNQMHSVGYLGSAILTKGKTGLGSLQQPLRELYTLHIQKKENQFQKRLLIISTEGLTFQWNDSGVDKYVNNNLSSVYDVQLLKIVNEKRKDKKFYCAFLPMGEENDPRYLNLFHQMDKSTLRLFDLQNNHPPIIALIMRRSTGIQALECHVFIPRSALEANQIVNCIRSACSKYKFDVTQQTDVFQYEPYVVDKTYETHMDLITGLNTSSNAISLNGSKINNENKKNKNEVNLGIKNSQSLLSKLKANLRDSSKENVNKNREGIPPLPVRKVSNVKIFNPSSSNLTKQEVVKSEQVQEVKKQSSSIVKGFETNKSIKQDSSKKLKSTMSQVNFDDKQSKKLNSQSTTSLKQPIQQQEHKKLSLGKRLLESAKSSLKPSSSKSSKILSSHSVTSLTNKKDSFDYRNQLADIDFRKSRTSFIDDNLLIDTNLIYPIVHHIKTDNTNHNQNFILKSRSTVATNTPLFVQNNSNSKSCQKTNSQLNLNKKLTTSYQSTPSLVIEETKVRHAPSSNDLFKPPLSTASSRAVSVAAVQRNPNPSRPVSPSRHYSVADLNERVKSPLQDPKLMSTHLVWNKNSKSAESLETKKVVSSVIQNEQSVIARTVSPCISSVNLNRTEAINKSQDCLSYSTRIRQSPIIQNRQSVLSNGPFTKSVIVIRSDDYNIIQPPDSSSTPLMGPFYKNATTIGASSNEIDLDSLQSKNSKSTSRLDLLKFQLEDNERSTSNASSYKLVTNGVKVLPTSLNNETEMQQRRARLKEIEDNLYKDSLSNFQQQQHHHFQQLNDIKATKSSEYYQFNSSFTDYSDNDHEIIDLTKQATLIDNAIKTTDLPIEICLSTPRTNSNELKINDRIINLEPYITTNIGSKTEFTTSSCYENESNTQINEQTKHYFNHLDNCNQINYVYYYGSNEDFGGY